LPNKSTLQTQVDGQFQFVAPLNNSFSGVIRVKVLAKSDTFDIEIRENKDSSAYYYEFEIPVPIINPDSSFSLSNLIIPDTNNSKTKAFSIYDAMYVAQSYAQMVRGEQLNDVEVNFPSSGSNFDEADGDGKPDGNNDLNIAEITSQDWDTLLHEYGHYLGA
jgi:hypothetical protein